MEKGLVSIIIVNWNGKKWLKECLKSVEKQSWPKIEVIFVDNASTDDSVKYVSNFHAKVKLVRAKTNLGFAGGNNLGLLSASGEYIYLLNNDTAIEPDCIEKLVMFISERPAVGSAQSKITSMRNKDTIDVAGSYWTNTGMLYHYGLNGKASDKKYNVDKPFFTNKGASMLIRRTCIDKVGLFDDDFWCYYEDTDLCNRLWIAGYECWYVPEANIFHAGGGTSLTFENSYIQYHNFKNKLLSFLKNLQCSTLCLILPPYLLLNFSLSIYWFFSGKPRHSFALYRSVSWNIKQLPRTLRKRSEIQKFRVLSDEAIFEKVKINPGIKYYVNLLLGSHT